MRGISYGIGGLLRGYPMGGFCNAGHGVVAADAEPSEKPVGKAPRSADTSTKTEASLNGLHPIRDLCPPNIIPHPLD